MLIHRKTTFTLTPLQSERLPREMMPVMVDWVNNLYPFLVMPVEEEFESLKFESEVKGTVGQMRVVTI
ncbi:hypothetical protein K1719_006590 [Acacia pycnantha]|nr:hypothetical protein K1719_006590 [Acacia pycnantha]